jgi:hypothetical protein
MKASSLCTLNIISKHYNLAELDLVSIGIPSGSRPVIMSDHDSIYLPAHTTFVDVT